MYLYLHIYVLTEYDWGYINRRDDHFRYQWHGNLFPIQISLE